MQLSNKIWQKIQDSFHFKKIKSKAPQSFKKTYPTDDEQLDMNIDQKEIALWSAQNLEILKQLQMDGFCDRIQNRQFLTQIYQELLLDSMQIQIIDQGILCFENLTCLSLNSNCLEKLQNLPQNLQELHVHQNQITTIDRSLKLTNLKYLGISLNKLTEKSLEKIAENFPNLVSLDASCNSICDMSKCIDYLQQGTQIKILNLFGNPLCLFSAYPVMIIKSLQELKYFDNKEVSKELKQQINDQAGNQILEQVKNSDGSSYETLNIQIGTLENIVGIYFEEQKIFSSYWIDYSFAPEIGYSQKEEVSLDKGEIKENDKFSIDFNHNFSYQISINDTNRDLFLKKFIINIYEREPKYTVNEETLEKLPVLVDQHPVYEDRQLGIALLDLSEWQISQIGFWCQDNPNIFSINQSFLTKLFYPQEDENRLINDLIENERQAKQELQKDVVKSTKDDKKAAAKPSKKDDKKGGKQSQVDNKIQIKNLDYQVKTRNGIYVSKEKNFRSIGPLLAVKVQIQTQ